MDAAGPAAAPADPPELKALPELQRITALVIVSVLVLFLQHTLGYLLRGSSNKLLHAVLSGGYTLSYSAVSYTIGLIQRSHEYYFFEFPVWAVCLVMRLGGTDSLTAYSLNDIHNWKSFCVKHLVKEGLVVYIVAVYGPGSRYLKPSLAILCVNILQSYARITSMRMAGNSHLLRKNVKPIADYMQHEDQPLVSDRKLNPGTMEGYRYIVAGELRQRIWAKQRERVPSADDAKITTVEQVWQCKGSLLRSARGLRLKDVCLSMALSKMLNRRFASFELAEVGLEKTHDFVFEGLLAGDKRYERAFRVIEVELAFVHDLYYSSYPYLYHKGRYFALFLPVAMVILCSLLTCQLYLRFKQSSESGSIILGYTLFTMVVVTFLEAFQLYLHMASGWFKVSLIESYVTRPMLQRSCCFSQTIIGVLLSLRVPRPWTYKLGQYSLLHKFDGTSHIKNCIHHVTLGLIDKAKKGRKRGKLVKLSTQVKQAVINSLVRSNGDLRNGGRSLQNNGVHGQLSWACDASIGTVTHIILVWHVATTLCNHQLDTQAKDKKLPVLSKEDRSAIDTASSVASSLSQYCAYLIAFAPTLLPDDITVSELILNESIKDTRKLLRGAKTMKSKCEALMRISAADEGAPQLVMQGARLARKLTEDILDPVLRWKVLSDFWGEMMLYVAPCDDTRAREHLDALARGGEFITHLWALLTHAGVLERGPVGPLAGV